MSLNLYTAWIAFLLGCISDAIPGIFFHNTNWLGGYSSWKRRMIRLAHISFFGIGALNLAFALTVYILEIKSGLVSISYLLIIGAITMPIICYLSAWNMFFRHWECSSYNFYKSFWSSRFGFLYPNGRVPSFSWQKKYRLT